MTDGTKGGAQRASSIRPRCFWEADPEIATHTITTYSQLVYFAVVFWSCNSAPHNITTGMLFETIHNAKADITRK
jgi:hypothetical protein